MIGDATAPGMGSADGDGVTSGGHGKPDDTGPNELGSVQAVFANDVEWNLRVIEGATGAGAFVEAVVSALPGEWGHVAKKGAQKQVNGHAVDAIAYKSPVRLYYGKWVQVIDIILAVGDSNAAPHWLPVDAPVGNTPDGNLGPNGPWYR